LWAFVDIFRMFGLMVLCCLPLIFLFKRIKHARPGGGSTLTVRHKSERVTLMEDFRKQFLFRSFVCKIKIPLRSPIMSAGIMTANPHKVFVPGMVGSGLLRAAIIIFARGSTIAKGNGCAVLPSVTFGMAIAKVKNCSSSMKGGGRVQKLCRRKWPASVSRRAIIFHSPGTYVFAAHIRSLHPDKPVRDAFDARPL
jgi:hypothetical protein